MPRFVKAAILPRIGGIHIGWILVVICIALVYTMFKKTKFGFEIDVIGESKASAHYAGINVAKVTFLAVFISGALCGMAGMMQASAMEKSLTYQLSGGMGFTAVITTYLGQLNPLIIVIVSFLFSMLIQGGSSIQASMGIPSSMSMVIQGIIIFFVLGSELFIRTNLLEQTTRRLQNDFSFTFFISSNLCSNRNTYSAWYKWWNS